MKVALIGRSVSLFTEASALRPAPIGARSDRAFARGDDYGSPGPANRSVEVLGFFVVGENGLSGRLYQA